MRPSPEGWVENYSGSRVEGTEMTLIQMVPSALGLCLCLDGAEIAHP
jgi:hypothetical protein